jgi:hypothetical protein
MNQLCSSTGAQPPPDVRHHEPLTGLPPVGRSQIGDAPSAEGFVAMLGLYRHTGGIERAADLAWLLDESSAAPGAALAGAPHEPGYMADLIKSGAVFGFRWRDTFWVPMFQFDLRDMSVKSSPRDVRVALAREYNPWGLAAWFAQSHAQLTYMSPVDMLDVNLPAVLHVAHTDRRLNRRN